MSMNLTRRAMLTGAVGAASLLTGAGHARAADKVVLRMSAVQTPTDLRSVGLEKYFAPAIAGFATYEPHYNGTLFRQNTELEAIARGNLEMSITSAQELATLIPEWSIFTAGYQMRSGEHQQRVFDSDVGKEMYAKVEDAIGVKLLQVIYLGRRQLNLKGKKKITTPADLAGVKLRMPGTEAWQFLGKALGANPVPMAFTEVYTALQTGAIDGQDNPLPTDKDSKFYEVTNQIVLTSHLVDMNFLAISKKVHDRFTPDQQATMRKAAKESADWILKAQSDKEEELVKFFKDQGLEVYTPDVEAFRRHVQKMYLESSLAKDWPKGMVDRINAIQ